MISLFVSKIICKFRYAWVVMGNESSRPKISVVIPALVR